MDEARSLTYSINVETNAAQAESDLRNLVGSIGSPGRIEINADTAQAESNLRRVTSDIGNLETDANSLGSAFRRSFLDSVDSGNTLSSSLKSGVGGAFDYVGGKASEFKNNVVSTAQNIGNGFAHPIETIKNGLGNAVEGARTKFIGMFRSAEDASDATEDLGDSANEASKDIKKIGDESDSAGNKLTSLANVAGKVGRAVAVALGVAIGAVGAFGVSSINTGMEFDSAMSQISATMGMTTADIANNVNGAGDTFNALRDKAKEMGAATNFSATQAAEGLNILAMSGFDATRSIDMIEDVLHLAAAGNMEMAQSADFISGALKGFNDATKDSGYYADLMAKGATLANTSVTELGQAISGGAATAAAYGQEADSMTLSLLRLAEQGVTGSAAATSLNAAMKDLYTPTDGAKKALSELGIAIYDENGKAREFNTIINELDGALAGMSDEQANAYKSTIFQIQGLQAFNKMTVTSIEKQEEWADALANASGEAANQYATMTDNLQGDIDIWHSALDGFKIALSDELTPTIREFVQFGSDGLGRLTKAFEEGGLGGAMSALGEILSDGLGMLTEALPDIADAGMQLIGALGQGIIDNLPTILDAALQIVGKIGQGLLDGLPILLTSAVEIIATLASGIGSAAPDIIPAVVETITVLVGTLINNLPLLLDAGMQLLMGVAQGIVNAIPVLIGQLPVLINEILGFITESLPMILEQGANLLLTLTTGIIDAIPLLVEQLPLIFDSILTFFTENVPSILEQGIQVIMNLATGILGALPSLIEQLPTIITGIVGFITENLPTIIETGINLLLQLASGIISAIPQLVAQLPAIIVAIVDGIGALLGSLVDVGKNIVEGIWNGISAMGSWIKDKVSGFFGGIVDGIKGLLGIHSPSTVFAGIGDNMAAGLGKGFESTMSGVAKDIEKSIPTEFDMPGVNTPAIADVTYGVNPVIGDFNPPDVDGGPGGPDPSVAGGGPSPESGGGGSTPFSPVITINIQGNADEETVEDMRTSLRDTVRELYEEFRAEELERQTLKNQYT